MAGQEHTTDERRARPLESGKVGRWAILTVMLSVVLTACSGPQSMLDPSGQVSRDVANLWWLMFWLGAAVFVVVLTLLLVSIFRGNRDPETSMSTKGRLRMVVLGGIIIPAIIIAIVFTGSTRSLLSMGDLRESSDVTIDVIAHQFWWEVRYPDENVVTANEIHVPVDRTVEIRLTSTDVIHSFWVPPLHGKIDMLPGKTNTLSLRPEETGTFRGQCAQFCGAQHANMALLVIVEEEEGYQEWVAHQSEPAAEPDEGSTVARGKEIYLSSACVYCHTIAGTASNGDLGPDLTHLASRETLAAGTLENNPGNLAGWIVDPQEIKPGNAMPAIDLTGEDLQALLEYLNSLD